MAEEDPTGVKRRRICAAGGSHQGISCLTDLPSGILAHAASFLAEPSKALLAIAVDENSAAPPNERSAAIVGSQWDILDFGQIEKELAAKLSDDDIQAVLLCIGAVNNVKRLKLANCIHINGTGLEPLRGSLIIEQIDLSLAGDHQDNFLGPRPPISCDIGLPILDSIIEREGCALMHLQFPFSFVWYREERSRFSDFHAFMLRYNEMLRSRGVVRCMECNTRLPTGQNQWIETRTLDNCYGLQRHTCYDCFKHYCYECVIGIEGERERMLSSCETCKRGYCTNCSKMHVCHFCGDSTCNDCYKNQCHKCNEKICLNCVDGHEDCYQCEGCGRIFCKECSDPGATDFERTCGGCRDTRCDDCIFERFQFGHNCSECMKTIGPLLADECKRLCQEVEQLKVEIKELRSKS